MCSLRLRRKSSGQALEYIDDIVSNGPRLQVAMRSTCMSQAEGHRDDTTNL